VHCTQISPEFECQGQMSRSPGTKQKTAEASPLTMHSRACAIGGTQQAATDDTIAWPPGGDRLRRWENQRMLSSFTALHAPPVHNCCKHKSLEGIFLH